MLPNLPSSNNKKQKKLYRKGQPFWNSDLDNLWKATCQAEKEYVSFKTFTQQDRTIKNVLKENFKFAQKKFDCKYRQIKRSHQKNKNENLKNSSPNDMWSTLKKLDNPPSSKAVLEIVKEDESISRDLREVLERWHKDISYLFSGLKENPDFAFDDQFYQQILEKKAEFENLPFEDQLETSNYDSASINSDILFSEVSDSIDRVKLGKAYLEIPNDALKNNNAKLLLHRFLNLCFKTGLNPTDWDFSNIKPIPKKDQDPRDPLQNRCLTIMCCVAKIYSKVLNVRLQKFLETNNILVDEQNGFRASRSCIDHLFVLCTILRNRKLSNQETFISFIDYKKAFDSVDRNLLLFKLSNIGINGNMYNAISSLYSNPRSRVVLNDYNTDYFDCPIGVKQGDCLSPTLFAIFINDLASEIKESNIGIKLSESETINILLYADDIVLLAESESNLQALLFIVECWCKKWKLEVNLTKTNVMHIRSNRKQLSRFVFLFDRKVIAYCKSYKYLGVNIDEFLDYNFTVAAQADSAGRGLSCIITKIIKKGGFPFNMYSMLYDACITSVSDYGGEVTGYNQYDSTLKIHLRAIRAFIGVPRNACSLGVMSEVDWLLPEFRTKMKMLRQYHRIVKMSNNRLTKKVFLWDKQLNETNVVFSWTNEVKAIFESCNLLNIYNSNSIFPLKATIKKVKTAFLAEQQNFLRAECSDKPKLRTFVKFKDYNVLPSYITKPLSFKQRKFIAKLRLGSLDIRIETGRFSQPRLEENERLCTVCNLNDPLQGLNPQIENETHFLFICSLYDQIRGDWMSKMQLPVEFNNLTVNEKLKVVLNDHNNVKLTSQFIIDAYDLRSRTIN